MDINQDINFAIAQIEPMRVFLNIDSFDRKKQMEMDIISCFSDTVSPQKVKETQKGRSDFRTASWQDKNGRISQIENQDPIMKH